LPAPSADEDERPRTGGDCLEEPRELRHLLLAPENGVQHALRVFRPRGNRRARPGHRDPDRARKPDRGATGILHLAPAGSRLYVAGSGAIWALDPQTGARIPLRLPRPPSEVLALTPSAGRVLVAGRA